MFIVFNADVKIDWSVFREFKQKPICSKFDLPLSYSKFSTAVKKLALHKMLELNGISSNVIIVLSDENREVLFEICSDYFKNDSTIEELQVGSLKIISEKGELSNPKN